MEGDEEDRVRSGGEKSGSVHAAIVVRAAVASRGRRVRRRTKRVGTAVAAADVSQGKETIAFGGSEAHGARARVHALGCVERGAGS